MINENIGRLFVLKLISETRFVKMLGFAILQTNKQKKGKGIFEGF